MSTDAPLAASIAAALAATDTAARALWEAMGAPGEYWFGTADSRCVTVQFRLIDGRGGSAHVVHGSGVVSATVFGASSVDRKIDDLPINDCRAALAAYLGAS